MVRRSDVQLQEGKSGMGQDRNTREKEEMRGQICKKVLLFVVDLVVEPILYC